MKIVIIPSIKYLINECILEEKTFVTGNTVIDVVYQSLEISKSGADSFKELGLKEKESFTAITHCTENVDNKELLGRILSGFSQIYKKFDFLNLLNIKAIGEFSFKVPEGVILNAVILRALESRHIKRFFHQQNQRPLTQLCRWTIFFSRTRRYAASLLVNKCEDILRNGCVVSEKITSFQHCGVTYLC